MGKASRRKKIKHDPANLLVLADFDHALYALGVCTREGCGRPRVEDVLWCSRCRTNARRLRASRRPRLPPKAEWLAELDALIKELS